MISAQTAWWLSILVLFWAGTTWESFGADYSLAGTQKAQRSKFPNSGFDISLGLEHHLKVGIANHHKILYQRKSEISNPQPMLALYKYFFISRLSLGVKFSIGQYTAEGKAAQTADSNPLIALPFRGKLTEENVDATSEVSLALMPVLLAGTARVSIVESNWLYTGLWAGLEWLRIQEIRSFSTQEDSTSTTTPTTNYVNSGSIVNQSLGAYLAIILDPLDYRSVSTLHFFGIRSVYLQLYYATSRLSESLTKSLASGFPEESLPNYDRDSIGISFIFSYL